jgi:hypothetical protein
MTILPETATEIETETGRGTETDREIETGTATVIETVIVTAIETATETERGVEAVKTTNPPAEQAVEVVEAVLRRQVAGTMTQAKMDVATEAGIARLLLPLQGMGTNDEVKNVSVKNRVVEVGDLLRLLCRVKSIIQRVTPHLRDHLRRGLLITNSEGSGK